MPLLDLPIPTIAELLLTERRALTAEYAVVDDISGEPLSAFVRDNLLYPFAIVLARRDQVLYGVARESASQGTPFGATGTNLDPWLELKGVSVPNEQTAQLQVETQGKESASIPVGTRIASLGGLLYTTDATVNFPAGPVLSPVLVTITAEEPGSIYNLQVGAEAQVDLIDDDISPTATVTSIVTIGQDPADDEGKAALLQAAFRSNTGFKTVNYYIAQTKQLDLSIGDVFIAKAGQGQGTVAIYPLLSLTGSEAENEPWLVKLPTGGQVAAWEASLSSDSVRGVNDRIFVLVIATPDITLEIDLEPNTAEVQAAVTRELQLLFLSFYGAEGYTIPNSEIGGAISRAPGEISHTILDVNGGGPAADAVALVGQLLQVGTITWS